MKYRFLGDVAISETAYEAIGATPEEAIANAGLALADVMADPAKIRAKEKRKILVEGDTHEKLLYNFLEELVYIKDVEGIIFNIFLVKISGKKLAAECTGEKLEDIGRENLRNDVKAVTMHMFGLKKKGKNYVATVVVDV